MKRVLLASALVCAAWSASTPVAFADDTGNPEAARTSHVDRAAPVRSASPAVKRVSAPTDEHARARTTPFAFRGISLGITLDEARASSMTRATPTDSELVCETDVNAGQLGMQLKSSDSLIVSCRWAHRSDEGANRWHVSRAVVDGVPAEDHVLRFARTADGGPLRLYEISFVVDGMTADDLRGALRARYGVPHMSTTASVPTYMWQNAVSSITLCMLPGSHSGTLTYLLKDPDTRVKSVERSWQDNLADAG
ncbi:hypothetical protein [Paraburkholderia phosphatilytica]|uniref:hypothetical protein n=1 Tax=Paraburkholderia phosphatilytica TaxID=2282883 RepID=UPI000E515CB4|nr:hypothetical protein [Paraburkholderia phosphatilytica]